MTKGSPGSRSKFSLNVEAAGWADEIGVEIELLHSNQHGRQTFKDFAAVIGGGKHDGDWKAIGDKSGRAVEDGGGRPDADGRSQHAGGGQDPGDHVVTTRFDHDSPHMGDRPVEHRAELKTRQHRTREAGHKSTVPCGSSQTALQLTSPAHPPRKDTMAIDSATIEINGDSSSWTLRQAEVVEAVSAPGFIRAEVLNESGSLDPKSLLYQSVTLKIPTTETGHEWRQVKGIVWEASSLGPFQRGDGRGVYRLVILPPMMVMSLRRLDRAFGAISAKQAWENVLAEWGAKVPYSDQGPMMVLENESCTELLQSSHQSMETDLQFLLRLLSIHGVFWYHDSDGDTQLPTLQMGTFSTGAKPWGAGTSLQYNPQVTGATFGPNVLQFTRSAYGGVRVPVVIGMHPALAPSVPPTNLDATAISPQADAFTGYDWFEEEGLSPMFGMNLSEMQSRCAKVLEQAMALEDVWAVGTATTSTVVAGRRISITDLPGGAGTEWFVTANRLLVAGPGIAAESDPDEPQILTSFRAVPLTTPFRTPLDASRMDPPPLAGGLDPHAFREVPHLGTTGLKHR